MGNEEDKIEKEIKICHSEPVIYNWQTITDEFRDACQGTTENRLKRFRAITKSLIDLHSFLPDLEVGELVQVEYFTMEKEIGGCHPGIGKVIAVTLD